MIGYPMQLVVWFPLRYVSLTNTLDQAYTVTDI